MSETATLDGCTDVHRRNWESFADFVDDMRKPGDRGNESSSVQNDEEWTGTKSYQHCLELADNGWPEGLKRMKKLMGDLRNIDTHDAERFLPRFVEAGDEVDVGRYLSGEPENMMEYNIVHVPASGRVVKLLVNVAASCGISAEAMFLRGAAAVMLSDLLEQSGLRAEIVVASAGRNGDAGVCYTVTVKRAEQPIELDRLAFMVACPSVFRRLMFRAYEQLPPEEFNKRIGSWYTLPMNADTKEPGAIVVDTLQYGFGNELNTDTDAIKFVDKMFDSLLKKDPTTVTP
jgi:hypothetical protein